MKLAYKAQTLSNEKNIKSIICIYINFIIFEPFNYPLKKTNINSNINIKSQSNFSFASLLLFSIQHFMCLISTSISLLCSPSRYPLLYCLYMTNATISLCWVILFIRFSAEIEALMESQGKFYFFLQSLKVSLYASSLVNSNHLPFSPFLTALHKNLSFFCAFSPMRDRVQTKSFLYLINPSFFSLTQNHFCPVLYQKKFKIFF